MAVHGRARWFYENMVDSGQYHTVETIIGLRGGGVCCLHRDNEFPLGRNYRCVRATSFANRGFFDP